MTTPTTPPAEATCRTGAPARPSATTAATPASGPARQVEGPTRRRTLRLLAGTLGAVAVTAGAAACGASAPVPAAGPGSGQNGSEATDATERADAAAALEHVHAIQYLGAPNGPITTATTSPRAGAAGAGSAVLVATHAGLFTVPTRGAGGRLRRVGPQVDLMGFTVDGEGTFLASGHPAPGTGLPEPLGLAASTDGGRTWQVLSRGGESDYHTLTVSRRGVIAYDGTLRFSADRRIWQDRPIPSPPRMLAAHWDTGQILATTESGLLHSSDDARTWSTLRPPALLSDVAWAGPDTIVGLSTEKVLVLSHDAGRTWRTGPGPVAPPPGVGGLDPLAAMTARHADAASTVSSGPPEVILAFGAMLLRTSDLGASSERLL